MAWLTWRQHRWAIISLVLAAVVGSWGFRRSLPVAGFYALLVQLSFGGLVGMFLGAPLIGRELEERTYFVAWGQDVTPVQWLRRKLILLASGVVLLAALLGISDRYTGSRGTLWSSFESSPLVQVGYVLMGLAIGVLAGLLTKHTLTAMAITLISFGVLRALLTFARGYYLPPHRRVVEWDQTWNVPRDAVVVGNGFVGSDLDSIDLTAQCEGHVSPSSCMRTARAAIGTYFEYQPVGRVGVFQFIEFLLCTLIAAAALTATFLWLRRGGGWRPSRAHRRDVVQDAPAQSAPATSAAQAEG